MSLFQASLGYFPALQEVWSGESFELGRLMWVVDLIWSSSEKKVEISAESSCLAEVSDDERAGIFGLY